MSSRTVTSVSGADRTGLYNLRQAGVLNAGSTPANGYGLYRADSPHDLTPAGAETLRQLGVTRTIDLRAIFENTRHPYLITGVTRTAHPFELVRQGDTAAELDLAHLYQRLLAESGSQFVAVVREVLAHRDGSVLIHCTAGKDRTGLVVALLLLSVGVAVEDVVADYAKTEANLAGEWTDRYLAQAPIELREIVNESVLNVLNGSPAEVMRASVEWIEANYGGASEYLTRHGLTQVELAALRNRLTGTDPQPALEETLREDIS